MVGREFQIQLAEHNRYWRRQTSYTGTTEL
ncbi:unnamed protein product [Acanthoscelides obtectus]|uniref:Uncharacterized protein n=1 Tax=Acanthoscelides obtectus TaxID=200917 RepID=A0A9P0M2U3_ACAOB|nr:unnamed protein product [Acanthoscelides obtectus]CAK1687724.1 hypothetical protein AOBTE_LOCUS36337 [Acanthoscelides obtectus]